MRSAILLLIAYFCICSSFIYIEVTFLTDSSWKNTMDMILGLECIAGLVGGLVCAFVIPANILFAFSIICFIIGSSILEWQGHILSENVQISSHYMVGFCASFTIFTMSFGLFNFLFIVILLDQKSTISVADRIIAWFLVHNLCYVIGYALVDKTDTLPNKIIGTFVIGLAAILLVTGAYFHIYRIETKTINIIRICKSFRKNQELLFATRDEYSISVNISLSKATLVFLQLLPFGLCSSQERYAYVYQSRFMRQPNLTDYSPFKQNFWPTIIDGSTAIIVLSIALVLRCLKYQWFIDLYSKIKLKIIIGIMFMILATMIGGVVENVRLKTFYDWNSTTIFPVYAIEQKIGNNTYLAADFSIFYMTPQIVLASLSEVLVILSCLEYLYSESVDNIKYLAVAFLLSATQNGGLSDVFSIGLFYSGIFNATNLSERIPKTNTHECCQYQSRLDCVLFLLSCLAAISLVISLIFMMKFKKYFKINGPVINSSISVKESVNVS